MTSPAREKRRWDALDYQRIVAASYRGGCVVVAFADGGEARLSPRVLVAPDATEPDWPRLRAEEFHLVVPSPAGDIEIPWDVIRVHADEEFEEYWESAVAESTPSTPPSRAKRVG